jgi:hypothetical protein
MTQPGVCPREREVVAQAHAGPLTVEIRRHLATCDACAEALLVTSFLQRATTEGSEELPPAGLVWWKAQLRLRREAEERAARPILWMERAALVLAAVSLGVAGTWWRVEAGPMLWWAAAAGLGVLGAVAAGAVWVAWSRRE